MCMWGRGAGGRGAGELAFLSCPRYVKIGAVGCNNPEP